MFSPQRIRTLRKWKFVAKLGRRRPVVEEKYTKPQGLYQHKDVDHKKLRKLILDSKLAPCYPGDEDCSSDLEECPICFLYYPSLNRSRCCMKGICTECFLQMKAPNTSRPTQCPFCKTLNYAVEYRGMKTKEEKGMEQMEEQRVIEAQIRIRKQELEDEELRMLKRQEMESSSRVISPAEVANSTVTVSDEVVSSQEPSLSTRESPRLRQTRDDEFDVDLEDLMVMEAIWLSIQENNRHGNSTNGNSVPTELYLTHDRSVSPTMPPPISESSSSSSSSGGLASAIAALAERQQRSSETSGNEQDRESFEMSGGSQRTPDEEWVVDHGSEAGTRRRHHQNSNEEDEEDRRSQISEAVGGGSIVPDSFEEQMMLAMAVSLAEARGPPGFGWQ